MNETVKKKVTGISRESAEAQVKILWDAYDIDMEYIPSDSHKAMENGMLALTKHVARGRIEIVKEGSNVLIKQNIQNVFDEKMKSLTYKQLSTLAKMEADKGEKATERINYLLGSLSGVGPAPLEKMTGIDTTVAECVGNFLFVV